MLPENRSGRPHPRNGHPEQTQTLTLSVPAADEWLAHIDGLIVVRLEMPGGKYRRRTFLSVSAAQRAIRNAQERGLNGRAYLCEARPLFEFRGTAQGELPGGEVA